MSYLSRAAVGASVVFAFIVTTCFGPAAAPAAVLFGRLDDFEDGTTLGWTEGFPSPNMPSNVADGGPGGAGDAYLRNASSGGVGAGGKQIMFNQDQWAGDYNAAGVTRVNGWFANFGPAPVNLRVAFEGSFSRFSSTRAFPLPADGVWRQASFDLAAASMTRVSGTAELSAALAAVNEFRLLSAGAPSYTGDTMVGTLGVDDLRALRPEGDANFDGRVDAADLRLVRANLGSPSGATWQEGDFNFDGRVNARDVALLRRNLAAPAGVSASGLAAVPEPAVVALLPALALLALARRPPARVRA